ncbi:hypothetical protein QBC35DRAFT_553565 [Podospora australis]|uniref:Uncharacterized protein n=1 Tax=Podospora australis TaxID=1536484 RepID=A0AAN6WSN1_9PEZI|nr:hypothetical protein QBC35DRAFT_553565 [Podospora australis]
MSKLTITHSSRAIVPLYISGRPLPIAPDRIFPIINAAQDKITHYAQAASVPEALSASASLLEESTTSIAATHSLETSAHPSFANFLPGAAAAILREVAGSLSTALTGSIPPGTGNDPSIHVLIEKKNPSALFF